ncbi:hypothetical protein HMPREF9108_00523 [Leptotrichia sp. oral taxon 225 str. F0581]|nr:hypothetical protein HMPREF9108_00523 [Leptotrichia sp. oral taxon 225 str. F0581]
MSFSTIKLGKKKFFFFVLIFIKSQYRLFIITVKHFKFRHKIKIFLHACMR